MFGSEVYFFVEGFNVLYEDRYVLLEDWLLIINIFLFIFIVYVKYCVICMGVMFFYIFFCGLYCLIVCRNLFLLFKLLIVYMRLL